MGLIIFQLFYFRNELKTVKFDHSSQIKNLLLEGSLYDANRETVLIFGGIDPHSHYGIGRNTGKDIYQYIPESNCWKFVTELPEPRHHHCVAFLHGRIYLVGKNPFIYCGNRIT